MHKLNSTARRNTKRKENNGGKPNEPLYSFQELADRLDLLPGQLRVAMYHRTEVEPLKHRLMAGKRKLYALSEAKKWLESVGGRDAIISPRGLHHAAYCNEHILSKL